MADPTEPTDVPRADMSPDLNAIDEIELSDLQVEAAGVDEDRTMFDPDVHPKPPSNKEEGTTDRDGKRDVDMMADTPAIDDDFLGVDFADEELTVEQDLEDVEPV